MATIINEATEAQGDDVGSIQRAANDRLYFLMRKRGENQPRLYQKDRDEEAVLIFDPASLMPDEEAPSIKYFNVSPNGQYLAVCLTAGGDENGVLHYLDLESGELVDGTLDRTRWGPGTWSDDSSCYFYSRLQELGPDTDPQETFQRSIIYLHRMGTTPDEDTPIYGIDVNEGVSVAPSDTSEATIIPGSGWMVITNSNGVAPDYILWFARVEGILAGKPEWKQLTKRSDVVGARGTSFAISGDDLYMITRKDAPNGKIIRVSLEDSDLSNAETIYAPERGVIQQLLHTAEGIYVRVLDGGPSRVFLLRNDAMNEPEEVVFPKQGRISFHGDSHTDPRFEGMLVTTHTWTHPGRHFYVDPESLKPQRVQLGKEDEPAICSELTSYQIMIPSHDGVEVPVSITHRKDLDMSVTHPVMLNAYGAYGITIEPRFYPSDAALYTLGGIKAIAHVRGGGAYGDAWRLAGYQETKPNTWKDLIAAAEGLVEKGLTTPKQIGITGGSAGGITVGRALTEKPEAFGAVVIIVGVSDTVRIETTPNGVPNIPEYGSSKTEEGFLSLFEMSPYHHVKDGTDYPPVLLCHGANDTRVDLWQSQKMAARLMSANPESHNVLLRIDYNAGHGAGSSVKQANGLYGDIVAFVLENCGK